mgnify:CR=1 FL=1
MRTVATTAATDGGPVCAGGSRSKAMASSSAVWVSSPRSAALGAGGPGLVVALPLASPPARGRVGVPGAELGAENLALTRVHLGPVRRADRRGLESTHLLDCTREHLVDLFGHCWLIGTRKAR